VATTEWVRALRLLARRPDGCPEAVMLADGFRLFVGAFSLMRSGHTSTESSPPDCESMCMRAMLPPTPEGQLVSPSFGGFGLTEGLPMPFRLGEVPDA
jgi:hypothetical protein